MRKAFDYIKQTIMDGLSTNCSSGNGNEVPGTPLNDIHPFGGPQMDECREDVTMDDHPERADLPDDVRKEILEDALQAAAADSSISLPVLEYIHGGVNTEETGDNWEIRCSNSLPELECQQDSDSIEASISDETSSLPSQAIANFRLSLLPSPSSTQIHSLESNAMEDGGVSGRPNTSRRFCGSGSRTTTEDRVIEEIAKKVVELLNKNKEEEKKAGNSNSVWRTPDLKSWASASMRRNSRHSCAYCVKEKGSSCSTLTTTTASALRPFTSKRLPSRRPTESKGCRKSAASKLASKRSTLARGCRKSTAPELPTRRSTAAKCKSNQGRPKPSRSLCRHSSTSRQSETLKSSVKQLSTATSSKVQQLLAAAMKRPKKASQRGSGVTRKACAGTTKSKLRAVCSCRSGHKNKSGRKLPSSIIKRVFRSIKEKFPSGKANGCE